MKFACLLAISIYLNGSFAIDFDQLEAKTWLDEFLTVAFGQIPPAAYDSEDITTVANGLKLATPFTVTKGAKKQLKIKIIKEGTREQIMKIHYGDTEIFSFLRKDFRHLYKGFQQFVANFNPGAKTGCVARNEDALAKLAAIVELPNDCVVEDAMAVDVDERPDQITVYKFKFMRNYDWNVYNFIKPKAPRKFPFPDDVEFMVEKSTTDCAYRYIVDDFDKIKIFDQSGITVNNYRPFLTLPNTFTQLPNAGFTDTSTKERVNFVWKKKASEAPNAAETALSVVEQSDNVFTMTYTSGIDTLFNLDVAKEFAVEIERYLQANKSSSIVFNCVLQANPKAYVCKKARLLVL